jgi:hypothetical protein
MVPSFFVQLEALPQTPNGKVDRRALPAPDPALATPATTYVAPRTPLEEVLAGIWADIIGVPQIGVEDDFFEAGGHSLSATRVIAQLHEIFGIALPVRTLFENPNIAGFAPVLIAEDPEQVEKTAALLIELSERSDEELEAMLLESGGSAVEDLL